MGNKGWIFDLRRAYPTMSINLFVKLLEENRESDNLLELLDEAESVAVEEKQKNELAMEELRKRLRVGEQHHKLNFMVEADIDLEHAQAILAYGFLMPGKDVVYAGTHTVPQQHVRTNVRNKLVGRYSEAKYDTALHYLIHEGVVLETGRKSNLGLSLNLDDKSRKVSTHGAQIIRVAKNYLHFK